MLSMQYEPSTCGTSLPILSPAIVTMFGILATTKSSTCKCLSALGPQLPVFGVPAVCKGACTSGAGCSASQNGLTTATDLTTLPFLSAPLVSGPGSARVPGPVKANLRCSTCLSVRWHWVQGPSKSSTSQVERWTQMGSILQRHCKMLVCSSVLTSLSLDSSPMLTKRRSIAARAALENDFRGQKSACTGVLTSTTCSQGSRTIRMSRKDGLHGRPKAQLPTHCFAQVLPGSLELQERHGVVQAHNPDSLR